MPAVHPVEVLGLGVVGLEVGVVDRPGRRDPVVVLQLAEVLGTQPEQSRAVELRVAADVVVDLRLERVVVPVVPGLGEAGTSPGRRPRCELQLSRSRGQVAAAFEEQHALAGGRQAVRDGAAAGTAADDDDVVVVVAHRGSAHRVGVGGPASGRRAACSRQPCAPAYGGGLRLGEPAARDRGRRLVQLADPRPGGLITATEVASAPTMPITAPTDMRTAPPTSRPRLISISAFVGPRCHAVLPGVRRALVRWSPGCRRCGRSTRGGRPPMLRAGRRGVVIPFELSPG